MSTFWIKSSYLVFLCGACIASSAEEWTKVKSPGLGLEFSYPPSWDLSAVDDDFSLKYSNARLERTCEENNSSDCGSFDLQTYTTIPRPTAFYLDKARAEKLKKDGVVAYAKYEHRSLATGTVITNTEEIVLGKKKWFCLDFLEEIGYGKRLSTACYTTFPSTKNELLLAVAGFSQYEKTTLVNERKERKELGPKFDHGKWQKMPRYKTKKEDMTLRPTFLQIMSKIGSFKDDGTKKP